MKYRKNRDKKTASVRASIAKKICATDIGKTSEERIAITKITPGIIKCFIFRNLSSLEIFETPYKKIGKLAI
ncbi:MAG: hypothetical protein QXK44_02715, partial [Archaeoglobaceae archaeon]